MNSLDLERQARLQAQAEHAERQRLPASGDAELDSYRLVIRALRQPLKARLPADFAARMAERITLPEEKSSLEDWLVTALLFGMAVAGLIYMQPVMATVVSRLQFEPPGLPTLPWPLLGATIASIAIAWALDRGAAGWFNGGQRGHRG
jgi:hypothetical protein